MKLSGYRRFFEGKRGLRCAVCARRMLGLDVDGRVFRSNILKKSYIRFVVGGLLVSLVSLAGCGSGNSQPRLAVHVQSDLLLPIGIPNADRKISDVVWDTEVVGKDADGDITLNMTMVSVKASVNTLGKVFEYDSVEPAKADEGAALENDSKKKGMAGHQAKFTAAFADLAGKSFRARVNADGESELLEIEEPLRKIAEGRFNHDSGNWGYDQAMLVFSARYLRDYASLAAGAIRGEECLGEGAEWSVDSSVQVPRAAAVALKRNYKYVGEQEQEDKTVLKVAEYAIAGDPEGKVPAAEMPGGAGKNSLNVLKCEGKGKIFFNNKNVPTKLEDTTIVEVRTTQGAARKKDDGNKRKIFYRIIRKIEILDN